MNIHALILRIASLPADEYMFVIGAIFLGLVLAMRHRWVNAAFMFSLGLLWLAYHATVALYIKGLSADSFVEAQHFDSDEARFWWLSLRERLYSDLSMNRLMLYSAIALSSFGLALLVLRRLMHLPLSACRRLIALVASLLMGLAVYNTTTYAVSTFVKNSHGFETIVSNFDQPVPTLPPARNRMELVIYIGESTSVMNMGLYGYPRDTTPLLSRLAREDDRMLVFRHVFSTHVHTSQSLLEALSFGLDPREDVLPIAKRRRLSLPTVLMRAGIDTQLMSNQGMRGASEQTGTIIFRHSQKTFRMEQELAAHRDGRDMPSRYDHEFFQTELARERAPADHARLTFLHSYAGHGPYYENIPPAFRRAVDSTLSQLPREQVVSDPRRKVNYIEEYDSAVRYVDYSVTQVVEHVRGRERPAVLVFFSDHGEVVFRDLGHDSAARFDHELVRVPFLLYFNEAARREYPAVYARYQSLARGGEVGTLAQLPSTLLDLLGIDAGQQAGRFGLVITPLIGERTKLPPILVREQERGITFLNLNLEPSLSSVAPSGQPLWELPDRDTRTFVALRSGRMTAAEICSSAPRTFADLSRQILVAGCTPPAGTPWAATITSTLSPPR
jgi:glucan phosphoethanolaminetransferase (alkaline phosphatase superfamily)